MSQTLQQTLHQAIDELVASGAESGVQVAVYRYGELVVDAVAGVADRETGRPMTPDTPIYSASTGKGVTATLANVLVAQEVLGYDEPIADLWPEFAAAERYGVRTWSWSTQTTWPWWLIRISGAPVAAVRRDRASPAIQRPPIRTCTDSGRVGVATGMGPDF
jgi:CubicO group peptidase (beta-lactamase class C family)